MTSAESFWSPFTLAFSASGDQGVELYLTPTDPDCDHNLVLSLTDEGITGLLRPRLDTGHAADLSVSLPSPIPEKVISALMEAQPALAEDFVPSNWR